jgi:hypothetical protein
MIMNFEQAAYLFALERIWTDAPGPIEEMARKARTLSATITILSHPDTQPCITGHTLPHPSRRHSAQSIAQADKIIASLGQHGANHSGESVTNQVADPAISESPNPPHYYEAICYAMQTGSLKSLLGPIAEASLREWAAGFLAAGALESQFPGEMSYPNLEQTEEWRSLQGPRSSAFAQGANEFRRQNLRSLSLNPTHRPCSTPVGCVATSTVGRREGEKQ